MPETNDGSGRIDDMSNAKRQRSLTGSAPDDERHQGFRALGVAVWKLAAPVAARRGGGVLVRLKAHWPAIVGSEWAAAAWPAAYGPDGVLKLLARPSAALELQHRAPLLIDRINFYLGRTAVNRLVLLQATLPFGAATLDPAPRFPDAASTEAVETLSGISDPGLRVALERFARAITIAPD
jgi:hypothetical protein